MKKARKKRASILLVEEVPAHCPRCKSTDREKQEGSITRHWSGVTQDGREYNQCRWAYATCRNCSQRYRIIRRELV
jgi:hypothetical protein